MNAPSQTVQGQPFSQPLSGQGEVYSFTTMYNVPHGYDEQKPYTVALVKLVDGPMVTAQLTDVAAEEVKIGMAVEMVTRKLREDGPEGQIVYGYKFRPLLSAQASER
ncbi:MAG TPA: Zn-ribbon domain-containing OB-fold protein [Caldilineaceae bacterium]|nr:Zn-ribbon domain-containing OB-fold protein [Caldilineaceae bacterium]